MNIKISSYTLMLITLSISLIILLWILGAAVMDEKKYNNDDLSMTACFAADSSGRCDRIDQDLATPRVCCNRYEKCCKR